MRFQDRVVIVTGAAGGIGTAIANRFAAEGARVVATDVNAEGVDATAATIRASGGRARGLAADISAAAGCAGIVADVLATEGRVDVLCNNAGLMRRGALLAITPEDWDISLAVTIADQDKLVPYGRVGKPEGVAALVAFLTSGEAAFMCGSLVEINGARAVA
jgi:NAD(P)-dependent dehydrogenase (short-subunit alcohol dehydrogenase family)